MALGRRDGSRRPVMSIVDRVAAGDGWVMPKDRRRCLAGLV